jgi:hypothetical protein
VRGAKAPGGTANCWWLGSRHRQQEVYTRAETLMAILDPRLKSSAWPPILVKPHVTWWFVPCWLRDPLGQWWFITNGTLVACGKRGHGGYVCEL